MTDLISKLYKRPSVESYTDISFKLPDGGTVQAHRLILAIASPFFEAQFFGLLAGDHNDTDEVKDVDSDAFRRLLDFIYNSGPVDWDMDSIEYWNLLHAAHMYLVPGLIEHCNDKLSEFMTSLEDNDELIAHVNKASQLSIYEDISKAGVVAIKERLGSIIHRDSWSTLQENVILDLVSDVNLKVSEGELFTGMVKWCRANTENEQEAVLKFQQKFADRIVVKNICEDTFLNIIGPSNYLSNDMFKAWTFEVLKNKVKAASRFALNPYKIKQTSIERKDFIEPRLPGGPTPFLDPIQYQQPNGQIADFDLWKTTDEFADVNIDIKIYQKISEGYHVPRGKFGILLETVHTSKIADKSCITERVSVKMVAKKSDGTVVKKLFKPIEDSFRESPDSRTNIFVLSKNKDERLTWHLMEIVVIIDRRPTCHIKGISGEKFATTVCSAPTVAYLDRAISFSYEVGRSIKESVEDIARKLEIKENDNSSLSQWLYIFTKGYVSNLRSRRALPNDYWTAETVEDYMRCKVINFPIGVQNEEMRRDAFRTWIISRKLADEREKDKKNLFVCTYNPSTSEVNFVKNICLNVETKTETLGILEHINLGTIKITDEFFNCVTFGTSVTMGYRIFIRRIFPIQNESDEKLEKLIVSEAKLGDSLTHIDDCHVIVIQEGGHNGGVDFDDFIISKIREITVRFEPRTEQNKSENSPSPARAEMATIDLALDPKIKILNIMTRLSEALNVQSSNLELFKCYSTKSMMKRPAEFPVELETEKNLETLLEWCKEGDKTIYYRFKSEPRKDGSPAAPSIFQSPEAADEASLAGPSRDLKGEMNLSVEEDIMDTE